MEPEIQTSRYVQYICMYHMNCIHINFVQLWDCYYDCYMQIVRSFIERQKLSVEAERVLCDEQGSEKADDFQY